MAKKQAKRPVGNPTFESKYYPEFAIDMVQAMADGKSVVRFCSSINITKTTFYRWLDEYKLRDAFELAQNHCEAHWEDWLVENLGNKDVNSTLIKLFFANRFGWHSEKVESKEHVIVTEKVVRMKNSKSAYEVKT